jgi:hypothetical protein
MFGGEEDDNFTIGEDGADNTFLGEILGLPASELARADASVPSLLPPPPHVEERERIHPRAANLCKHAQCTLKKAGKNSFCTKHRKLNDNMKSDAARAGESTLIDNMDITCMDYADLLDKYEIDVGLPSVTGNTAGSFAWAEYKKTFSTETSVDDQGEALKVDHVGYVAYMMRERMKSKEQANIDWFEAVLDRDVFSKRDWGGKGECGVTLNCQREECAGGKLRLHIVGQDRVVASQKSTEASVVTAAGKQKKRPNATDIDSLRNDLGQGHDKFASKRFGAVGGDTFKGRDHSFEQAMVPPLTTLAKPAKAAKACSSKASSPGDSDFETPKAKRAKASSNDLDTDDAGMDSICLLDF